MTYYHLLRKSFVILLGITLFSFITSCDKSEEPTPVTVSKPTVKTASDIGSSGFTVEFLAVTGVSNYQLDIATDIDFTTFVSGYASKSISETTVIIADLAPETNYYYRVRSVLDDEISENSLTKSVTTRSLGFESQSLKLVADFPIGNIIQSNRVAGDHKTILSEHFNSITAEYEMKMDIMYPNENQFDFSRADIIVDFSESIDAQVHGHALIWHSSVPGWVENFSGSDQEFEDMIENYITTTVSRYKGRVKSWDVVNEAIADGSNTLRNSIFRQKMGDDFIKKCFQFARNADPNALLFYNDYNISWNEGKLNATLDIADGLGDLIDGIGFQMHINIGFPSQETLTTHTKRVVDKGLLMHYAEVDMRVNSKNDDSYVFSNEDKEKQKQAYGMVVNVFRNNVPDAQKYALTVWGLRDDESWLKSPDFGGHPREYPLLFDQNFNKKPAFEGLLEALKQ